VSAEADTYPLDAPGKADLIDSSIGEMSPFTNLRLLCPRRGARDGSPASQLEKPMRAHSERDTHGVLGLCLSPVDLAVSKLAAGREKDLSFVTGMLRHGLVDFELVDRIVAEVADDRRESVRSCLRRCQQAATA